MRFNVPLGVDANPVFPADHHHLSKAVGVDGVVGKPDLVALILLVTFSVNQNVNNLSVNLLAIINVSVLLLGWLSSANWVQESPLNNFLEIVFLCSMVITSAALYTSTFSTRRVLS